MKARAFAGAVLLTALLGPLPVLAAGTDPDWPCVQAKVAEISAGQIWAGPPIEGAAGAWRDDPAVAELVPTLVARRTSMEEAAAAISRFAEAAGPEKTRKLTLLFAGMLEEINFERGRIISGIERRVRSQRALSERITTESEALARKPADASAQASADRRQQEEALRWDTRIYQERQQALAYVCESPVLLEQRAFALAREIQNHLD